MKWHPFGGVRKRFAKVQPFGFIFKLLEGRITTQRIKSLNGHFKGVAPTVIISNYVLLSV